MAGDAATVGRVLGAAVALRERSGGVLMKAERRDVDRAVNRIGDETEMSEGFAAGRSDPEAVVVSVRSQSVAN